MVSQQCWTAQAKAKLIKQKHAKCLWAWYVWFPVSPHLQFFLQLCHSPLQHPPVLMSRKREGGWGEDRKWSIEKETPQKWSENRWGRIEERASTDSRGGHSEADEATKTTCNLIGRDALPFSPAPAGLNSHWSAPVSVGYRKCYNIITSL